MHQLTDNAVVAHDHNGSNIYEVVEDLQSMPEFGSGLACLLPLRLNGTGFRQQGRHLTVRLRGNYAAE